MAGTSFGLESDWTDFYSELLADDVHVYEWYFSYKILKPFLVADLNRYCGNVKEFKLLLGGCGNSELSGDLYTDGFKNVVSFDYSSTCVEIMRKKYADVPIVFDVEDCTKLSYENEMFTHYIDKGLYDAVACRDDKHESLVSMVKEMRRVLVLGGLLIIISHTHYDSRKDYFPSNNWNFNACTSLGSGKWIYALTAI